MFERLKTAVSGAAFPATDWKLVDDARAEHGSGPAHERFCKLYWYPVYAFIRRSWRWKSHDEALEATQDFFALRLEKCDLGNADQYRGRLRDWIKAAVTNLLRNQRKYDHAKKRDRRKLVWIDAMVAEARFRLEPKTTLDPLRLFERDLAHGVLERTLTRLGGEYAARDEAVFFARAVRLIVPGEADAGYAELERRWGLRPQTLKVRINTMRRRFAELVRRELGVPDGDPKAAETELAWLFQALDLFDPDRELRLDSVEESDVAAKPSTEGESSWTNAGTPAGDAA
jgi:hypothetical protein